MEPGKTAFFQALGIPTKIARGTIEITTDLKLVEAGGKVGPSEATLLNMLNISPFTYGMSISQVYDDGQCFASAVLDISEEDLIKAFLGAIKAIACISLAANYPTLPSVAHSLVNAYKKAVAVALATDYCWEAIEELKDRIANPDAYASAAPVATSSGPTETKAAEEEKKADEDDESEEDGMLHSLRCATDQMLTFPQVVSVVFSIKTVGEGVVFFLKKKIILYSAVLGHDSLSTHSLS